MIAKTLFYSVILFSSLIICEPPNVSCSQTLIYATAYTCPTDVKLGSGASAVSFKIKHKTGRMDLIKVQYINDSDKKAKALREVEILKKCNHPNVIRLHENIQATTLMYTILELGELGSLEKMVQTDSIKGTNKFKTDPAFVLQMFRGLLAGTQHIHSQGWAHADLKTGNVVVAEGYTPKIIDFDLAVPLGTMASRRGTAVYMDPNVMFCDENYKFDATPDIYSLGIILYEMTHDGLTPFENNNIKEVIRLLSQNKITIAEGTDLMIAYLIARSTLNNKDYRLPISTMITEIDNYLLKGEFKKIKKTTINMEKPMTINDFEIIPEIKTPAQQDLYSKEKYTGQAYQFGGKGLDIGKGPVKPVDLGLNNNYPPVEEIKYAQPTPLGGYFGETPQLKRQPTYEVKNDWKKTPEARPKDYLQKPSAHAYGANLQTPGLTNDYSKPTALQNQPYVPGAYNKPADLGKPADYMRPDYTPGDYNKPGDYKQAPVGYKNEYNLPGDSKKTPALNDNKIYADLNKAPVGYKNEYNLPNDYKKASPLENYLVPYANMVKKDIENIQPLRIKNNNVGQPPINGYPEAKPTNNKPARLPSYSEYPADVREIFLKYDKKKLGIQRALGEGTEANDADLYHKPIEVDGTNKFGVWIVLAFFSLAISLPFAAFLAKRAYAVWVKSESGLAAKPTTPVQTITPPATTDNVVVVTNKV